MALSSSMLARRTSDVCPPLRLLLCCLLWCWLLLVLLPLGANSIIPKCQANPYTSVSLLPFLLLLLLCLSRLLVWLCWLGHFTLIGCAVRLAARCLCAAGRGR